MALALAYFLLYPLVVSLGLAAVRRRRAAAWWGCALAYTLLSFALIWAVPGPAGQHRQGHRDLTEALAYSLCPAVTMFTALRLEVFDRRLYLLPPCGVLLFWLGNVIAVNVMILAGYGL